MLLKHRSLMFCLVPLMVGPEEEGVLEVADGVADEEEKEEEKGEESKGAPRWGEGRREVACFKNSLQPLMSSC